eukprot:gene5827-biopygen8814
MAVPQAPPGEGGSNSGDARSFLMGGSCSALAHCMQLFPTSPLVGSRATRARPAGCATARGSDAAIGRCLERQALPRTAESDVIQAPGISATRPAAGQPAGAAAGAA